MRKKLLLLQVFVLVLYLLSEVVGINGYFRVFFAVSVFTSGAIMLYEVRKLKRIKFEASLIAIGIFVYGLVYTFENLLVDMSTNGIYISQYLYILVTGIFLVSCLTYFIRNIKEFHRFQLLLDAGFVMIFTILMLYSIVIEQFPLFDENMVDNVRNILFIMTNGLILVSTVILIISTRKNKFNPLLKWYIIGILAYVFLEVVYLMQWVTDVWDYVRYVEMMYAFVFAIFAVASLYFTEEDRSKRVVAIPDFNYSNIGKSKVPQVMFAVSVITFLIIRFPMVRVFHLLGLMIIYWFCASFLKNLLMAERLLAQEKLLKSKLESVIDERTNELIYRSERDMLTGMYNRRYFFDYVNDLVKAKREFSLLYIDLNRFKVVNDVHGHQLGDKVLKVVAKRLLDNRCESCKIARIGGDEFSVVIDSTEWEKITELRQLYTEIISEEIRFDDYKFSLSASMGVARYPADADSVEALIRYADTVMYQMKKNPNNPNMKNFDKTLIDDINRRHRIEWLLKNINYDDEFYLNYQPLFSAQTKEVLGVEALIRWKNDELGFVSPAEFIPIAEDINAIKEISEWVIRQSFKQLKEWQKKHNESFGLGINVSPLLFNSIDFMPYLKDSLIKYQIEAPCVTVEITEHSAMSAIDNMIGVFDDLREMNVDIAIDDFGTGYSSLSYLKQFKVHDLKIAKELVDNIVDDRADRLIIESIVNMAHGLGLKVIAEGVETEEQLAILKVLNCDIIQGYLWGRPMDVEGINTLLNAS